MIDYLRDGAEIYRHSFATIREEADLAPEQETQVRYIHKAAEGLLELGA